MGEHTIPCLYHLTALYCLCITNVYYSMQNLTLTSFAVAYVLVIVAIPVIPVPHLSRGIPIFYLFHFIYFIFVSLQMNVGLKPCAKIILLGGACTRLMYLPIYSALHPIYAGVAFYCTCPSIIGYGVNKLTEVGIGQGQIFICIHQSIVNSLSVSININRKLLNQRGTKNKSKQRIISKSFH